MLIAFKKHWRIYLIEAWALGMFMVSASFFVILIEHPDFPVRAMIESSILRRLLIGLAMGITAIFLIYSKWGKLSGAHMNPAVTLAFFQIDRIDKKDAAWYIVAQFTGGYLGMLAFQLLAPGYMAHTSVNYITTIPGVAGTWIALLLEIILSFVLFMTVLISSNDRRWAKYTGILAGIWLTVFITLEAPYSGMSINPARTVASALPAGIWLGWWLYFIGPIVGMITAGAIYRRQYLKQHNGDCTTMRCHLSGNLHNCPTYDVY